MGLTDKLKHAWNTFTNKDPTPYNWANLGPSSSTRPDRKRMRSSNSKSTVLPLYNKIAIDVSSIIISHVRLDPNRKYLEDIKSDLNYALTKEANIDQTGRSLIQDIVMSMFDEGCVAVVPIDTTINPSISSAYDIQTLRTGKIVEWYPEKVKVELYNQATGLNEQITLRKDTVAIIENPLYAIVNEPNSTLKRLIRKLNNLDAIDEQSGSGKLDLIIQLPYVIKTEARRQQADIRRKDIETQLSGSKYGIAYTDGTEKVTQLNRPTENNLMAQITYLTNELYNQLGLTENVFNGTADEKEMLNYFTRTIEPILLSITEEMDRKFLTKTARTQNQAITYFRDPFKLIPVTALSEVADKFTRNEILSSNEVRSIIGYKPSPDPKADELKNKNLNPNIQNGQTPEPQTNPNLPTPDPIEHSGVKGMHWGIHKTDTETINDMRMVLKSLKGSDYNEFQAPTNIYFKKVKYKNEKPIGFVLSQKYKDKNKTVIDLSVAVDPEYRNLGIASSLANDSIKHAMKDKDASIIQWAAKKDNTSSILLAKKLGFDHDRDTDNYSIYKKDILNKKGENNNEIQF